jgi:uncharacterized protein (DUF1684 family)
MELFRQDKRDGSRLGGTRAVLAWSCLLAAITTLAASSCGHPQDARLCHPALLQDFAAYKQRIEAARAQRDSLFHDPKSSPVAPGDLPSWKGLQFYPVAARYVLEGPLIRAEKPTPLVIRATKDDLRKATEIGYFWIDLGAGPEKLPVYNMQDDSELFCPFLDETSGVETYPAGRYLPLEALGEGRYRIDFNRAYNPYCAYGGNWSCPITPEKNRLKVAVRAGERGYKYLHE